MSGLNNTQIDELKHSMHLTEEVCKTKLIDLLWYTTTKQAQLQRSKAFDGGIFDKNSEKYNTTIDKYALLWLKRELHLAKAEQADNCKDLEERVSLIYNDKEKALFLLEDDDVIFSFFDKLRNSVAHGTFNFLQENSAVFVGQTSGSLASPMNFYLCIDDVSKLGVLMDNLVAFAQVDPNEFQSYVYSMYHSLVKVSDCCYEREDGIRVFFDNVFKFEDKINVKQVDQLKAYIENHYTEPNKNPEMIDYLLLSCSTTANLDVFEADYGIKVISGNKLIDHLASN